MHPHYIELMELLIVKFAGQNEGDIFLLRLQVQKFENVYNELFEVVGAQVY